MRVLNLYAGIGGNRKLWTDVDVTAVELNPDIAAIYQDFFPDDTVIIADAHQYLLDHYKEFDFIWSSPPCPTHSDIRRMAVHAGAYAAKYPDMGLYQEIILLKHFAPPGQLWTIENVRPYYTALMAPQYELQRHFIWCNFKVHINSIKTEREAHNNISSGSTVFDINLKDYKVDNKRKILRNMVDPELGLHIFNAARNHTEPIQTGLFAEV